MNTQEKYNELLYIVEGVGKKAFDYFNTPETENSLKQDGSIVTEVDNALEKSIREYILTNFPNDSITGEEEGSSSGESEYVWYVDPIDGTDNFLRKIPFFAISIARLGETPEESFAIVHNPATKRTFSTFGETEGGVYENKTICKITPENLGGKYVFSIGRGTKEGWMKPATYALHAVLGTKYGRSTALNCTALELSYVAANRIDAFLTYGLNPYDYAAGLFLAKAAGAAISVLDDGEWKLWKDSLKNLCARENNIIFVSHTDLHKEFLETIGDPRDWADKK